MQFIFLELHTVHTQELVFGFSFGVVVKYYTILKTVKRRAGKRMYNLYLPGNLRVDPEFYVLQC